MPVYWDEDAAFGSELSEEGLSEEERDSFCPLPSNGQVGPVLAKTADLDPWKIVDVQANSFECAW